MAAATSYEQFDLSVCGLSLLRDNWSDRKLVYCVAVCVVALCDVCPPPPGMPLELFCYGLCMGM